MAEQLLAKAEIEYEKKLANENVDFCNAFGVKQAPTLVVIKDGEAVSFKGVPGVKDFLNTVK